MFVFLAVALIIAFVFGPVSEQELLIGLAAMGLLAAAETITTRR